MYIKRSNLKKMRRDVGLTQNQLAEMIGVSQAHIAKIENEKVDPRLSTINKILKILVEGKGKKCGEIKIKNVITLSPNTKVIEACRLMTEKAISQIPVVKEKKVIGMITEEAIIQNIKPNIEEETIEKVMVPPLPSFSEETELSVIKPILETHPGVLITKRGELTGIITRSDLLKVISNLNISQ